VRRSRLHVVAAEPARREEAPQAERRWRHSELGRGEADTRTSWRRRKVSVSGAYAMPSNCESSPQSPTNLFSGSLKGRRAGEPSMP
jgi:hypothetical protein